MTTFLMVLIVLVVLSTGAVLAFSPVPSSLSINNNVLITKESWGSNHHHNAYRRRGHCEPTALIAAIKSSSSSSSTKLYDASYDYCQLVDSEAEQTRLNSQYENYSHENWLRHRAGDRFYRNFLKIDTSPIVQSLLDEVAILATICVIVITWNELVIDGYTDFNSIHHDPIVSEAFPDFLKIKLGLPTEPFFLCSGPLGLLLVFRNDASFGRYKEAFHYWETVVTSLSNMLLMASHASPSNVDGVHDMGKASLALCRTLQHEVLGGFDPVANYECDINEIFAPNEGQARRLLTARNKIYRAQYDIHEAVDTFKDEISNLDQRTLINTVNVVATACVECERLYTTPIPLLYTRHALKFLTFWMTFMPLAFYDVFAKSWNHIGMIPAISVICFLFFGIEEIAVSLEEPFSILPLNEMIEEFSLNIEDTTKWMTEKQSLQQNEEKQ